MNPRILADNYRRRFPRLAIGVAAIAVAGAVAMTNASAQLPQGGTVKVVPASLPAGAAVVATTADDIRSRIESAAGLVAAGEKLHGTLLRQFYAAFNYQPVWPTHPAQAEALLRLVLRADEHGLDPDRFHGAALRDLNALPPTDRELLLSDAILGYADALARGALPVETRIDDEDLRPEPIDVAAVLAQALGTPDPAAAIAGLAPTWPAYLELKRALAEYRAGVGSDPAAAARAALLHQAKRGPAAESPSDIRLRQIIVNMERLRWLPRQLPAERVWVNSANAQLVLYRDDKPVFTTRVVVGEADKQTPELQATITAVLFNPPWNVPISILKDEIMPQLSRNPDYLSRHHMVYRSNGMVQQLPGPQAALGQLKLEMPNRFDVYLHDTPLKNLFSLDNRRRSHGCIRVQNPRELAALLLQHPVEDINKAIALGSTNSRPLPSPVPVFVVYQTAFLDSNGSLEFRPDVYGRDDEMWQLLRPLRQAPVAQREPAGQPPG